MTRAFKSNFGHKISCLIFLLKFTVLTMPCGVWLVAYTLIYADCISAHIAYCTNVISVFMQASYEYILRK